MIQQIVERERMLEEIERREKERYKQETKQYLLNFKSRVNETKANQEELDRILKEEMEKQFQKRLREWKLEDQNRTELIYEIYRGREEALQYKKMMKDRELAEKEAVREELGMDQELFQR